MIAHLFHTFCFISSLIEQFIERQALSLEHEAWFLPQKDSWFNKGNKH